MGVEKNSVPDSPEAFIADRFIAGILGKPTWRVKCNNSVLLSCFNNVQMIFVYTKLKMKDYETIILHVENTNETF